MICNFLGCVNPTRAKGLCDSHYRQQKRGKELTPINEHRTDEVRSKYVPTPKEVDMLWRNRLKPPGR